VDVFPVGPKSENLAAVNMSHVPTVPNSSFLIPIEKHIHLIHLNEVITNDYEDFDQVDVEKS